MTEAAPVTEAPAPRRGVAGRRIGLFALAFVLMMGVAVASMVRFTGPMAPRAPRAPRMAAAGDASPIAVAAPSGLIIPVAGVRPRDIVDTWGQSRAGGARAHTATDIMAPGGTPVLAAAAGTVEKLHESAAGGHTVYVRSTDRTWSYYYAHLAAYAPDIAEGRGVRAGQTIAFVGDTGNAGPGNYHLHFGIAHLRPQDRWWQGEPINPYPLLAAPRAGR